MKRRGQSSTIFIVVAAAVALIILVVLIAVFTGRFGVFEKKLESCQGQCVPESQCTAIAPEGDCPEIIIPIPTLHGLFFGPSGEMKCCLLKK